MTAPYQPRVPGELPQADASPLGGIDEGAGPGRRHITDYLRILYRRRKIMAAVFALVVGSSVVYTSTRVPIYEARAKLLIESTDPQYFRFEKVVDERAGANDYYQTQYDLLKSRALARRTLESANLWERFGARRRDAYAADPAPPPPPGLIARARSVARSAFGFLRPPPPPPAEDLSRETLAERSAINRLLGGLVVAPLIRSRIVDLKYRSPDPDLATVAVNAHARSYIEQNMEFKFTASKEASDWLAERLADQRKQVEDASAALQRYREQNDALVAADDGDNIVIRRLGDLSEAVTRAKTQRLEKEAIYNQLRAIENDSPALDTYPAILSSPVVQQQQTELAQLQRRRLDLSQTYLDTHPEMEALSKQIAAVQTRLRGEVAKVVQGVRNEYLAAVAQEQSLAQALAEQKGEALSMNRKAIEYGVLNRELESTRSVYQTLLQRAQETGVSGEQRTSNVRIVDLAERPASPVYPNRQANIRTGVLGGLTLALLIGFFFEYFDNRIRTVDEIKAHLQLPCLGLLPMEPAPSGDAASPQPGRGSPRFLESLRALRTSIVFSTGDHGCRSLLITSTGPGEGKTTVSSNMAVSMAETGMRVLVIDADMRKPKLHTAFGLAQEPGLSNLIVGTSKASEVVVKTSTPGLWFVPAGHLPPNPAELLGSPRFRELLTSLRDHFDWVIIDTPPVMAVTDASVIAHRVSGIVFVVGAEMISRQHAAVALEQLQLARAKILGAVLNRVDVDRNALYYAPYYRKEYVDYYQKPRAVVLDKT